MTVAFYLVLTLHIICCLFLIAVVLLQQGKGQDLASAFGGAGTQTAFGPRAGATVLSRATTILAALFMVTSLMLAILAPSSSILQSLPGAPAPTTSAAPAVLPTVQPSVAPTVAPTASPTSPTAATPSPATR
jgi:preprotein translocase subunit SecG